MAPDSPIPSWENSLTPERRALDFVDFAVDQVEQLAPLLPYGYGLDGVVRAAFMESFMVNVRLLVEFLTFDLDPKDRRARDFVPGFASQDTAAVARLKDAWTLASRHVMHLSKDRTPDLDDLEHVTAEQIQRMARDCRAVYDEFRAQLA
ncbi:MULTISPECIES: hypothetical protein [unclassified Streptomyces]|uniref:hypothetical protein n=1 Tax=unclassified Streptomyces TaxID=2593676 RepID=UPI003D90B0E0